MLDAVDATICTLSISFNSIKYKSIFVNVTQHERLCQDVHLIFIVTTTSTYVIFHTLLTSLFTVLNLWEVAESDIRPDTTLKHVLKVL